MSERKEFLENIEDHMSEIYVRFFQKELVETSRELVCKDLAGLGRAVLEQHPHYLDRVNDVSTACNSTHKVIAESVLNRDMEVSVDRD